MRHEDFYTSHRVGLAGEPRLGTPKPLRTNRGLSRVEGRRPSMRFLFTCDAELTSVPDNEERNAIGDELLRVGLPRILDLCARFDIVGTFYFTANLVALRPECLALVRQPGHEIGCHGLRHDPSVSFDRLGYEEQVRSIAAARDILRRPGAPGAPACP